MPSPIDILPPEIFADVLNLLSKHDKNQLMRVSRAYHVFIERTLWDSIEMHPPGMHVFLAHKPLKKEEAFLRREPLRSDYTWESSHNLCTYWKSMKLLHLFSSYTEVAGGLTEARKSHLGSLITRLCLTVQWDPPSWSELPPRSDPWNAFTWFPSLEYLEISAFWVRPEAFVRFSAPSPTLRKLHTLKLRGYLPEEFVQWLLADAESLEVLHLGVLDLPIDSSYNTLNGRYLEELSLSLHDSVGPRALACLSPITMERLTKLKRLHLLRPTIGDPSEEGIFYFSSQSEQRILEEWNTLIRASSQTLEHIVLEQRPIAHESEPDGTGNGEFMRLYANTPSNQKFAELVLPTLLESEQFPALKKIHLFGFGAHWNHLENQGHLLPHHSVNLPAQLQRALPDVEVSNHVGRRLLVNDDGEIVGSMQHVVFETSNAYDSPSERDSDEE